MQVLTCRWAALNISETGNCCIKFSYINYYKTNSSITNKDDNLLLDDACRTLINHLLNWAIFLVVKVIYNSVTKKKIIFGLD